MAQPAEVAGEQAVHPATGDTKLPSYAEVLAQPAPVAENGANGRDLLPDSGSNGQQTGVGPPQVNGIVAHPPTTGNGVARRRTSDAAVQWLGVRWVPWSVPLTRRMQTAAVFIHTHTIFFAAATFFFCCANPLLWPIIFFYMYYLLFMDSAPSDGKLAWRSEWFRSWRFWKLFASYFPAELHKTVDLPADRKYIFGYHPHGIISHGAFTAFATDALGFKEKFPGITNSLLTLDIQFRIPIHREYLLKLGINSVSKESISKLLKTGGPNGKGQGRAVTIVIGGARESLERQRNGVMNLVLRNRVGFIKMAIRHGADLVPVLGFGETELYDQVDGQENAWLGKLQHFLIRFAKFTLPIMRGRSVLNYDYGLMPRRRRLDIVVGRPMRIEPVEGDPFTLSRLKELHLRYCDELQKLFDENKVKYGAGPDAQLHFLG